MKTLLPYQLKGVERLLKRKKALLADEMGLGKTVQVAELIRQLSLQPGKFAKAIVLCPSSLKINWQRELEEQLEHVDVGVEIVQNAKHILEDGRKVFIASYSIAGKASITSQLTNLQANMLICDEAHNLKNPKTKQSKVANNLAKFAQRIVLITGTPMPNCPIEVYPLLKLVAKEEMGRYADYYSFAHRYAGAKRLPWGLDVRGASNLTELRERMEPCMIRRLKKNELKELPDKSIQVISLEHTPATRKLIKQEGKYNFNDLKDNKHQATIGDFAALRREQATAKLPQAIAHIKDVLASVNKVVIFAYHREVVAGLTEKLSENFGVTSISGASTACERQNAVDSFQKDPENQVFVGQITAAGTGITLTAASTVIFVEFTWTPSDIAQAIDRCHRIGQKDAVLAQFLCIAGSMDERMLNTMVRKKSIINTILKPKEE